MNRERALVLLRRRREQLVAGIETLRARGLGQSARDSVGELSMYDNHPADVGSETFEREKDLGLVTSHKRQLRDVDEALRRVYQGSYGRCAGCGLPIGDARLEVVPEASLCTHCQARAEAPTAGVRPPEEAVIRPPFGHQDLASHGPAYDGRDTWEDVAFHGTASTPQDQPGATGYDDLHLEEEVDDGAVQEVEAIIDDQGEPLSEPVRRRRTKRGR
jgi:YteA family regulatory protein